MRQRRCRRLKIFGVLERQNTGQRDVESQCKGLFGKGSAGRKAVNHAGESPLPHFLRQDRDCVGLGGARVDDQRQAGFSSGGDMGAEASPLPVAVAVIIEIIESGFTNPDDPGMRGSRNQSGRVDVGMRVRFVRVDADRRPDIGMRVGERDHLRPLALPRRNAKHGANTGGASAFDYAVNVLA